MPRIKGELIVYHSLDDLSKAQRKEALASAAKYHISEEKAGMWLNYIIAFEKGNISKRTFKRYTDIKIPKVDDQNNQEVRS